MKFDSAIPKSPFLALVAAALLPSCNKHLVLMSQTAKINEERASMIEQMRKVEDEITRASPRTDIAKRDVDEINKKAAETETAAKASLARWQEVRESFERVRADARAFESPLN